MTKIHRSKQQETGYIPSNWKLVLAILSFIGVVVMFDETMILPAIPDLIHQFNITYSTSIWILSSYIIAGAVMTPIAGKLSDLYGRKKILLIVMTIYSIGLLSGRFSTNIELMVISRIAQGVGIAMFPIAFGIIRDVIPMEKLAIGQTIFGSTFAGGAAVGVVVGAIIIQNYGWAATFLAIFPISIALLCIVWRFIKLPDDSNESNLEQISDNGHMVENTNEITEQDVDKIAKNTRMDINSHSLIQKIDLKGTLALAITIVSFLAGISMLENIHISTAIQIGVLFIISAISLIVFVMIERRATLPILDLNLITDRLFVTPIIVLMIVSMSIFMVYQTIPVLVRSPLPLGFGGDALASANIQLPFMIVLFVGTILSGFLLNKIGNIRLLVFGTAISAIGFLSLFLFHSSDPWVAAGLTVISCGLALSMAGVFNLILISVPMRLTGIALGMTVLLNMIGISIGPAIGGIFQQLNQGTVTRILGSFPNANAYNMIFLTALVLSVFSFVLAILISRRKGVNVGEISKI
jgi:MFS family permease